MRRRLGARKRRVFWDYSELFAVTLLLVFWSVLYRALLTIDVVTGSGEVYDGWLYGDGVPLLWMQALMISGSLAMTAGCLLEARNRTRLGYSLAATNVGFVVFLGIALANHTAIATEQAVARFEGRRTAANLRRDVLGSWEVVERREPSQAPRFPGDVVLLTGYREVRVRKNVDPTHVETWWSVWADEYVAVDLPLTRWCSIFCFSGETQVFELTSVEDRYRAPALELDVLSRIPRSGKTWWEQRRWVAAVGDANPNELVLRSLAEPGESAATSSVKLQRASVPATGLDLGADLAHLREEVRWW